MLAYKKNNAVLINTITRGIDDSHFGNIKGQVALVRGSVTVFGHVVEHHQKAVERVGLVTHMC